MRARLRQIAAECLTPLGSPRVSARRLRQVALIRLLAYPLI